MSTEQQAA